MQERVLHAALDVEVQVLLERDDLMGVRERGGIRADSDEACGLVDELGRDRDRDLPHEGGHAPAAGLGAEEGGRGGG
jgi:hypothetical protein